MIEFLKVLCRRLFERNSKNKKLMNNLKKASENKIRLKKGTHVEKVNDHAFRIISDKELSFDEVVKLVENFMEEN